MIFPTHLSHRTIGILIVISIAAIALGLGWSRAFSLEAKVHACATYPGEERFSCYRAAIEKNWNKKDLKAYITKLMDESITFENDERTYSINGTNCHTFYHAVGDFAATKGGEYTFLELLSLGTPRCTAAYAMGLYKRYAYDHDYPPGLAEEYYRECYIGSNHQCAHEIGHSWHDKYIESILPVMDKITEEKFGIAAPKAIREVHNPDLKQPFEDCRKLLPENEWSYCYSGIGHSMFLFSAFNPGGYPAEIKRCDELSGKEDRAQCYRQFIYRVGANYVGPYFLRGQHDEGIKLCNEVIASVSDETLRAQNLTACYLGVGGGIGLYVESEFLHKDVPDEDVPRFRDELLSYVRMCEKVPREHQDTCFTGILGTTVKTAYIKYRMHHPVIERLIPIIGDYQAVGYNYVARLLHV
jgi:hypothetical protein